MFTGAWKCKCFGLLLLQYEYDTQAMVAETATTLSLFGGGEALVQV
jgi:hypothetical protein